MSDPIVCRLRRFNPARVMRGREGAEVEIDGQILWMSRRDIQKNIDKLGPLPGLVDAQKAYKEGVRIDKIIFDEPHNCETSANNGSSFVDVGAVTIGCMHPEASDLLQDVMDAYRSHYNKETHTADPEQVYQFAYWLCRWSGLVKRAATPRRRLDVRTGYVLYATCPGCGRTGETGIPSEVLTGVVKCGHCGVTSTPFIEK